jgi:DNA mismatch repair ATPase MutL
MLAHAEQTTAAQQLTDEQTRSRTKASCTQAAPSAYASTSKAPSSSRSSSRSSSSSSSSSSSEESKEGASSSDRGQMKQKQIGGEGQKRCRAGEQIPATCKQHAHDNLFFLMWCSLSSKAQLALNRAKIPVGLSGKAKIYVFGVRKSVRFNFPRTRASAHLHNQESIQLLLRFGAE